MELVIKNRGKELKIKNIRLVSNPLLDFGLMFKKRDKLQNILFEFEKPTDVKIHSWFINSDFLAIYLDKDNNVQDVILVKPWCHSIRPKNKFYKILEIPLG